MKAATGELNLTLITVVAIGLISTLFFTVLWPSIKAKLESNTENTANVTAIVDNKILLDNYEITY